MYEVVVHYEQKGLSLNQVHVRLRQVQRQCNQLQQQQRYLEDYLR